MPELAATGTGPPVCAAGEYDAELRSALLAYKERGRRALAAPLSAYLSDATDVLLRTARAESSGRQPVLIPVPSRRAAARQRGGDHVLRLARLVARHSQLPVSRVLSVSPAVADSAGLSTAARAANLAHRMRAAPPERHQLEAVLLDDIVTTGATLAEAGRALTEAGWRVLGAAVVGATRRRYPVAAGTGMHASNWADEQE
jgi:predicted amidophosphoribosyltransferase